MIHAFVAYVTIIQLYTRLFKNGDFFFSINTYPSMRAVTSPVYRRFDPQPTKS